MSPFCTRPFGERRQTCLTFYNGLRGCARPRTHPSLTTFAEFQRGHGDTSCLGNVSETPTPTTCPKSTAVHLQFVWQYPPPPRLYRRTFLASKLRRKGNPAIRLPFVLQYTSHLYSSTPPICTAVLLEKYWGLGVTGTFLNNSNHLTSYSTVPHHWRKLEEIGEFSSQGPKAQNHVSGHCGFRTCFKRR